MHFSTGSDGDESLHEADGSVHPRKRQRLTHLSPGEKLQRRKMKNRVAAQAARDRRKVYMDELEDQVAELKTANQQLLEQNEQLRLLTYCPNCSSNNSVSESQPVSSALVKPESTSKSAVLSPQQKEQTQTLLALMTVLSSLVSQGQILQKNCGNCIPSSNVISTLQSLDLTQKLKLKRLQNISQQWWGPHQNAWNPTETV